MLLLLKPYWHMLTVYWSNAGDEYPETRQVIEQVKQWVPNFVEVKGSVELTRLKHGWPSDLMQAGASWPWGAEMIAGHVKLIDRYACCYMSHMAPLHDRMQLDGITLLLRGQRDSDEPKSHIKSGQTVDGFTIFYPIQDWTTEQVEQYIKDAGQQLPEFYSHGMTSAPDCMHCTAWLEHGAHKYLQARHPNTARVVAEKLRQIRVTVEPFMQRLTAVQEELDGAK